MEKINKKKVSQLPEASNTNGFYAFGTDNNNNSVKVSIDLLKGNKGDNGDSPTIGTNGNWWIAGVDTGQTAQSVPNNKTVFNISQYNNKYNYTDAIAARNAVPTDLRGLGQIIIYKLALGEWATEHYIGTDTTAWATVANWEELGMPENILTRNDLLAIDGFVEESSITGNLLDGLTITWKNNYYINDQGVETYLANQYKYNTTRIYVNANTTYNTDIGNLQLGVVFYKQDGTFISRWSGTKTSRQFTTPDQTAYIVINREMADNMTGKQIAADGQEQPEGMITLKLDISQIKDAQQYEFTSNNLFDINDVNTGYYIDDSGILHPLAGYAYTNPIPISKNNNYYLTFMKSTFMGVWLDSSRVFLEAIPRDNVNTSGIITPPDSAAYIQVNVHLTNEPNKKLYTESDYNKIGSQGYYIPNLYANSIDGGSSSAPDTSVDDTFAIWNRNTNTFAGAMNTVISALIAAKPRAKFVFITHFSQDRKHGAAQGKPLGARYCTNLIIAQKAIADYWNVPCLVLPHHLGWVFRDGIDTLAQNIPDGIHPAGSLDAIAQYTQVCTEFLRPLFESWEGKKIAWYGTSIPNGYPNHTYATRYPNQVADKLGATIQNYGVDGGGVRMTMTGGAAVNTASFLDTATANNYQNKMVSLIGTANEPDLFVFDYGVNDHSADESDFNGLVKWLIYNNYPIVK